MATPLAVRQAKVSRANESVSWFASKAVCQDERSSVISAIALRCEALGARRYVHGFRADARAVLELLSLQPYELSLVLTEDSAIRELNRAFRSQDRSTDVLSFPQLEEPVADGIAIPPRHAAAGLATLGDVVISIETASRQAQRQGITPESRLRALLVHGVLHLLGYDHETSRADAQRMFAKERELLAALARRKRHRSAVRTQRAEQKGFTRATLAMSFDTTRRHTAF